MQPIARPDRPLPSNLFETGLFKDRRAHKERLAVHPQKQRGGVPSRGDKAPRRLKRGLFIGMERLGIELTRERHDIGGRNINPAVFNHFTERKVFEIEHVRHWPLNSQSGNA